MSVVLPGRKNRAIRARNSTCSQRSTPRPSIQSMLRALISSVKRAKVANAPAARMAGIHPWNMGDIRPVDCVRKKKTPALISAQVRPVKAMNER